MTHAFEAELDALTLEEKISLVSGADMWHTAEVPRLGIPALWMSDGPNGVRGTQFSGSTTSVCFPCGAALGATFDPELVEQVGAALGREARAMGVHVLLGPTINISRLPVAGRNFECFSEDPKLASLLAAAYVRGVQSEHVAAVAKHFVCNDSEHERYTTSSDVDERALREVYLAPFHAAVVDADVWAVMSGYNRVNGVAACEHEELLGGVLKGEWGFTGPVLSDWYGTTSTVASALGGLDVEMPGPSMRWGAKLLREVRDGVVPPSVLDDKVRRLLRLAARVADRPEPGRYVSPAPLIRRVAAEATVLLRNEGAVLPLDPERLRTVAVIGPNASRVQLHGGGSARVNAPYVVSPLDAVRRRCGDTTEVVYEPGCRIERALPLLDARSLAGTSQLVAEPVTVEYFDNLELDGVPVATEHAPGFNFAWNGPPLPVLTVGKFSARLRATLHPGASGIGMLGMLGVGRTRLLVDGRIVVDNWDEPVVAPMLFGRGAGQLAVDVPLEAGRPVEVEVEFQAPGEDLARRALEMSPAPPTEKENRAFGPAGVSVGYLAPGARDLLGRAERATAGADAVVVVVGVNEDWESEGFDRDSMSLPGEQDELIARVASAHPRVVVVVNAGSPVAMPWAGDVAAILQLWLPGQEAGSALADVLFGDVNPSARLPVTVPYELADSGAAAGYPAADGHLAYADGINVGYRHFDATAKEPRYCFGHGLSYTSFSYGSAEVSSGEDGAPVVAVEVENVGARDGAEVVQCYVSAVAPSVERPPRELRGVAKLRLAPGERAIARFVLDAAAFSYWNASAHRWSVDAGEYEVALAASSRDVRSVTTLRVDSNARIA